MSASIAQVREPPAMMFAGRWASVTELRKKYDSRISAMETARLSWWSSFRELSRFIRPRLGRFNDTPNQPRGASRTQRIIDDTATQASKRFGAGLQSGVSSPARPWFKLKLARKAVIPGSPAAMWLDEVQKRMFDVLSGSNAYRSLASIYEEVGVFGSAVMLVYEDFDDVIRCYPLTAGEYYLAVDDRLDPATLGRKFVMTVGAMVGKFGLDNVSDTVARMYRDNVLDQEFMVSHLICKNDARIVDAFGVAGAPWVEAFWEWGSSQDCLLQLKGYHEKPFMAVRWDVTSSDAYGGCPGMDCIGQVKMLQTLQRRLSQAVDKSVNPPLVADAGLRNEPATAIPGGVTYIPAGANTIGFKPLYEIRPDLAGMQGIIGAVQKRIQSAFFEDLFLMISQLDTTRTATEITERKEEKMLMLGPALERLHDELLMPFVERLFAVMSRFKMFPAPPADVQGDHIGVEFVSILAQAQKAVATASIERLFAFVGSIAGIKPEVTDNVDADEAVREYADMIGAPAGLVVDLDAVKAARAAREQQAQQQASLQQGLAAATGAKTLAQTDIGGGANALQRVTGMG
jgi:hypothetical protein